MTDPANNTTITIWDDPESRVQFLEQTLVDRDWRATILYPQGNETALQKREKTKRELEQRGYLVKEGSTPEGQPTLTLHHLGDDSSIRDVLSDMGLVKGGMHVLTNPTMPFSQFLHGGQKAWDGLHHYFNSPAKVNGFIFCVAEAFLSVAGADNEKSDKHFFARYADSWRNPSSALQNFAGMLYLGQSLTYMLAAKNNTDLALSHLDKKVSQLTEQGKDSTDIHYDPTQDKAHEGFGHTLSQFLRAHPIEIGAMSNNLGMAAYIGHAILEKRHCAGILEHPSGQLAEAIERAEKYIHQGGFKRDVGGALTSITAWSLLLVKPKTAPHHDGHISLWDRFRENPQVVTGLLTTASSGQRLAGALAKGNQKQAIGEGLYIPGDLLLMGTKNDEYGKATQSDPRELAEGIVEYINRMPIILSSEQQQRFAHDIAAYLNEKTIEDLPPAKRISMRVELEQRTEGLANAITHRLEKNECDPMDLLAESVVKLVQKFPESARKDLESKLAVTLAAYPSVYATAPELQEEFDQASTRLGKARAPTSKLVQMREIAPEVATLVGRIPAVDIANLASHIHEAIAPHLGLGAARQSSEPHDAPLHRADQQRLHDAMRTEIKSRLHPQIPPPVAQVAGR